VEHDYDIVGHPQADFHFCVTFPFHPAPGGRRGGEARPRAAHAELRTALRLIFEGV